MKADPILARVQPFANAFAKSMTELVRTRVEQVVTDTLARVERSIKDAIASASAEPAPGGG